MTGLTPIPLSVLASRMFAELRRNDSIFDLPARRFVLGDPGRDLSVNVHGRRAATPFGPAAGPHTQLAQNIVLAWLGGARIIELKTVQIIDTLEIPRPCIDMATIGYNVEWSQELRLSQSLEEYVKAWMLIHALVASGELKLAPGFADTVFDMSVGYDLKGVKTEPMRAFIKGLKDASAIIDRLRPEMPEAFRDLPYPARISDTLTLSTFHGCPPEEIEGIADHLMREHGLSVVVKLNPTLVGRDDMRSILNERLGYTELNVPDEAFEKDASWEQAMGICERLEATAKSLGVGFGVKFSNTLIVENHRDFFPASEKVMYTSGAPLHVLAVELVRRFRRRFGDRIPVSFSAGVDERNFAGVVALGLVPVTACSDLLKPGGYGRAWRMFEQLHKAMAGLGATDLATYTKRALAGSSDGAELSEARLKNTEAYADSVLSDPRYGRAATNTPPRRVGTELGLLDCLTCDKCVPVCPNDANFTFPIPKGTEIPTWTATKAGDRWTVTAGEPIVVSRPHQIANLADACNECGNCDVFCPESGGPYKVKPRFFLDPATWEHQSGRDGMLVSGPTIRARVDGVEYRVERGTPARFVGPDFDVVFDPTDPAGTISGEGTTVDLGLYSTLSALVDGASAGVNWVGD